MVRFFSFFFLKFSCPFPFFLTNFPFLPAYSFLDPTLQGPKLAAYIIGIAVAEVIIFCLIKIVETLRDRWAVRRGLVLEEADTSRCPVLDDEDWQEIERPSNVKGVSEC